MSGRCEAVESDGGGSGTSGGGGGGEEAGGEEEGGEEDEDERASALLGQPCEPLSVLLTSRAVQRWEEEQRFSWPAEVAAAQARLLH